MTTKLQSAKELGPDSGPELTDLDAQTEATFVESKAEQRLVRKLDCFILPNLALIYLTHTLDRANLGNAKTDGIEKDLGLKAGQFSQVLTYFYITYTIFAIPASLLARRFNPANVIPALTIIWGAAAVGSAFSRDFGSLLAARIVIGAAEAGFKPAVMYYLTIFYTRKELALRMAVWGTTGFLAGAIGGIISWDVFQWTGKPLQGWQYLFIIEGSITMGVAALSFFTLPRNVAASRYFTKEDEEIWRIRFERGFQQTDTNIHWSVALRSLKVWQIWVFSFMGLCYGVGQASASNFLPSIVRRLTDSTPKANLYTVGPNLVGGALEIFWCWLSDKYQQRALVATGAMVFAVVGFICLGSVNLTTNSGAGYFFTYLLEVGTFTSGALIPSWLSSNLPDATTRATALGVLYSFTNLAGIISSESFRTQDAPVYRPALIVTGSFQGAFIVVGLIMRQYYVSLNKKLDSGKIPQVSGTEGIVGYRYAI